MTPKEFAHTTMLVSSLRTRLGHANALTAAVKSERDDLTKQLAAHVESLKQSNAQCGEYLRQNEQLHSELVDVRAALAATTEQRDSLQRTLDEWSNADTEPHDRVTADDDVADHVVPPILHVGEPDPANDAKDAKLEFRNVVPTPEMIAHVGYWDLVSGAAAIAFRSGGLRLVFWRIAGSQEWRTDPCPQPLKPHGMTWQQLDRALANTKSVPPVLPMCTTCHGCGSLLEDAGAELLCPCPDCDLYGTKDKLSPYLGPCKSQHQVRHE